MTYTEPLFPEITYAVGDPLPNPCGYPLFIIAYWPRGRYWSIKSPLECDELSSPTLQAKIRDLQGAGWQHITIMRLPAGPHPWNTPSQ